VRLGVEVLAPPMQLLLASDGHRVRVSEGMRRLRALIAESSNATGAGASTAARTSQEGSSQVGDQVGSTSQEGSTTQVGTWSLERSGCPSADPAASLGNQPASTGPCGPYWAGLQGVSAFQHADTLLAIDALLGAGVAGIFSDFPAAVSAVANCRSANTQLKSAYGGAGF
jgi:hypothetical protein